MSTFAGLNTALSALRYQQVALDVANGNIANVSTAGYVRRRAEAGAVSGGDQPSMWSRYAGHGDGVGVQGVTRLADAMLDARSRRENATLSYLATQQTVLGRVETAINEPGDNGLSAALQELRAAFHDLVADPAGAAARETVLAKSAAVGSAFKAQSDNLTAETAGQREHALAVVQQVNDAATELARLNKTIRVAQVNSTDVGALQDDRDRLAMQLAQLTGAVTTVRGDGQYDLAVNDVPLVTGDTAAAMSASTGSPVTVSIGGAPVGAGLGGELGGVVDLLSTSLPAYKSSLDALATDFVAQVNAQHAAGKGLDGVAGRALFAITDPGNPAASLTVAIGDRGQLAAAAATAGAYDGSNADALSAPTAVESDYAALVTRFGATVAAANRQAANQQVLTGQVDDEREQLAGVSLDEETVNMLTAQHAYEAASKVMTVMDSLLDTLINRTGVTR